jgi:hypothetical protein
MKLLNVLNSSRDRCDGASIFIIRGSLAPRMMKEKVGQLMFDAGNYGVRTLNQLPKNLVSNSKGGVIGDLARYTGDARLNDDRVDGPLLMLVRQGELINLWDDSVHDDIDELNNAIQQLNMYCR